MPAFSQDLLCLMHAGPGMPQGPPMEGPPAGFRRVPARWGPCPSCPASSLCQYAEGLWCDHEACWAHSNRVTAWMQENEARAGPLAPHLKALGMPVLRHHAQPLQASPIVNTISNFHRPMASPPVAAMSRGPPAAESLSLAQACRRQQS